MDKKRVLSIAASAVLAGTVFVGCSWNDDDATAPSSSTSTLTVQASIVNGISAGGLTLDFDGDLCVNNTDLNSSTESLTLSTSQFVKLEDNAVACAHAVTEDYKVSVNPLLAMARASLGATPVLLANEIGTEPLRGEKGKKVNIFSTIAVENNATVEDIDANDNSIVEAKKLIQNMMALGTPLKTLVPDLTTANSFIAEIKAIKAAPTTAPITQLTAAVTRQNTYANANGLTVITAPASVTDINTTNANLVNDVEAAAEAPKLSLSSAAITVGGNTYTAASNGFTVAATAPATAPSDISFKLNVSALNLSGVLTDTAVVKAKISSATKGNIELTITNVKIEENGTNGVKVTLGTSSVVTMATTVPTLVATIGGSSLSKTITTPLVQTDLEFNLNTLLSALGALNSTTKANILEDLGSFAIQSGTYSVAVGISGLPTGTQTNLAASTLLGGDFKGVAGTLNVTATTSSSSSSVASSSVASSSVASSSVASSSSSSSVASSSSSSEASSSTSSEASSSSGTQTETVEE